ncbi:enoyl-CoA hydratase/isomerase family protein [Nocardia crassostreae]|uniref:enoyl-CoA hydratase/isomerase family protein n=1 Tax=Nocardia crassostreae TaxID=53428 RepID=UPI00082C2F24|nr:enoyl-CoA hydratase-related protein [Nocardia crassostreae]
MSAVLLEVDRGVAVLTLNRPERRNAFTADMGRALGEHYRTLDSDDAVRVIVLTGAPPAFCAGADLSGRDETFRAADSPGFSASPVHPPAFALRKPVIAAINGHAIGIGLTLALQADIRIMATESDYAVRQVRLGVLPDAMSHWTLPRVAGMAAAAEIMLTGRTFDAARAVQLGLASLALPAAEVLPAALELARDMATHVAPMSAALCKRALWDTARHNLGPEEVEELETELHRLVMGSPDAAEGVRAFLERRPPRWSARLSTEWREPSIPAHGRTMQR